MTSSSVLLGREGGMARSQPFPPVPSLFCSFLSSPSTSRGTANVVDRSIPGSSNRGTFCFSSS